MTRSAAGPLGNCRVLVVEDEFYIADDVALALRTLGAEVVGPVPTKDKALALLDSEKTIDVAILDINLKEQAVYPVADALAQRGVPFVFATGYTAAAVPPEYQAVPLWEKPFDPQELARALPAVLGVECKRPGGRQSPPRQR